MWEVAFSSGRMAYHSQGTDHCAFSFLVQGEPGIKRSERCGARVFREGGKKVSEKCAKREVWWGLG
jgi:hypothetical protein